MVLSAGFFLNDTSMLSLLSARPVRFCLFLAVLVVGASLAYRSPLPARLWFEVSRWFSSDTSAIGLDHYRVTLEALPLTGLDNISALTYDPDRNTLFTVTNKQPELIELSLEGEVLRRIPLEGLDDPEAVEYIALGTYVISDERQQRLVQVEVDDHTQRLNAADAHHLSLGLGLNGNKGFEGLAYDGASKRLFVAKEQDPVRIYEVSGFPMGGAGPVAVSIAENPERDRAMFVKDLSSLQFDPRTGHLMVVSDESRVLVELNTDGKPVASLSLVAGAAGLKRNVPQAEGIAMDAEGTLYIVSEPNLFYRFEPQPAH